MLSKLLKSVKAVAKATPKFCAKNSTTLLMIGASVGVVGTGYLAFSSGVKTGRALQAAETLYSDEPVELTRKEKAKIAWTASKGTIIGAATTGALTIGQIISSGIIDIRRQKALSTALALSTEAARTYKDKVIETLGEKKEAELRSKVAQDEEDKDPIGDSYIIETGKGSTLYKDGITKRYFRSDPEWIRKAQEDANGWYLAGEDFISINEWYSMLGLEECEDLDELGWNVDETIKFDIVWICVGDDHEPCGVINYDVSPRYMYHR